jgi:hypothetical protein
MLIIPKEEFRAFWAASFYCRDERVWQNRVFLGDAMTINMKPGADRQPCVILEEGKFTEEEFTLADALKRLQWKWNTKFQIQNAALMDIEKGNKNDKHVDCGCDGAKISGYGEIQEHGIQTVISKDKKPNYSKTS